MKMADPEGQMITCGNHALIIGNIRSLVKAVPRKAAMCLFENRVMR